MIERADILVKVGDNHVWTAGAWRDLHRTGFRIQRGIDLRAEATAVLDALGPSVTTGSEPYTLAMSKLKSANRIDALAAMTDDELEAERDEFNVGVYRDGDVIEVITESQAEAFHDGYIRVGNEVAAAAWRRSGGGFERPFSDEVERVHFGIYHPGITQAEADKWNGPKMVNGKIRGRSPVKAAMFKPDRISGATETKIKDKAVRVKIRRDKPIASDWMEPL